MSLWKIAWRSIQQRSLASTLTGISMALGVALVVAVLVVSHVVENYFETGRGLGYNLVIGKKGSSLQLVMNTVYYMDRPIENIPWSYYKEFLPASQRLDGQNGKFAAWIDKAVPVNLGDYFRGFRVIGTTAQMFGALELTPGQPFEFSAGENFPPDDYFTGVIGSTVAEQTGLRVGDTFQPTHGVPAEGDDHAHEEKFRVTGILERTGTPIDRALYVNLEGFFLIPDHAGDSEAIQSSLGGKTKGENQEPEDTQIEKRDDHTDHEHEKAGDDAKDRDVDHDHAKEIKDAKAASVKDEHDHDHDAEADQSLPTTKPDQGHEHDHEDENVSAKPSTPQTHDHDDHQHEHVDNAKEAAHDHAQDKVEVKAATAVKSADHDPADHEAPAAAQHEHDHEHDGHQHAKPTADAAHDHDHVEEHSAGASKEVHDHDHVEAKEPSAAAKEVHAHAQDHEHEHEKEHASASAAHDHEHAHDHAHDHGHDHGHDHDHGHHHHPLPEEQREVTAILVLTKSIAGLPPEAAAQQIVTPINKGVVAQAVQPIGVITQFLATFLNPLRAILLGLTVLIVVVSGIGILVSIYNSMAERRHEIAVMRALGAGRMTVMRIMLLESVLLALVGGLAGWLLCHVVLSVLTPWLTDWTGVAFTAFHFTGAELLLIPGIIALASLVGFLPAWSAYRTDVAKALTANP